MNDVAAGSVDSQGMDTSATDARDLRGVRFASADERDSDCARLERAGLVVVELEGVGPSARGRLAEAIDEAIERELAARGAAGPGIASGFDHAPLHVDARSASDRDAALSDQLFRARSAGATGMVVALGPLRAAAGPFSALEPEDCATLRFLATATRDRPLMLVLDARDAKTGAYGDPIGLKALLAPHAATATSTATATATATATPTPTPTSTPTPATPTPPSPPLGLTAGAAVVEREERWRAWTLQLTAARGPQPLSALERLFAESYMPLANAIAGGVDDSRARRAHDEFRDTFSAGYAEAFATFAATSKRPRMVLDVHDVAAKIARLHGARSTRVLLVDSMRWDVSRVVEERLMEKLGARASLTDEVLLWSSLPTTTMRQLETIARGVEAIRSPAEIDADPEPPRGRTAEHVRRLRVGPREVHKLDLLEARVTEARGHVLSSLPEIAGAVADAIARHVETFAPRTLLFVTGDHGFAIDKTGAAHHGGASPEEVLVGAFALLVADVH